MTKEVKQAAVKADIETKQLPKKKRRPLGMDAGKLKVANQDPNFHYRWAETENPDRPNRVRRLQEAGYEIVLEGEVNHIYSGTDPDLLGQPVTTTSGSKKMVLMKIPNEFFFEDQLAKEEAIREDMRRRKLEKNTTLNVSNSLDQPNF